MPLWISYNSYNKILPYLQVYFYFFPRKKNKVTYKSQSLSTLYSKNPVFALCSPCVFSRKTLLPFEVGCGNYSAGNFPASPPPNPWPTNGKPSERWAENSLFAIAAHLCRKSVGHVRPPSGPRVSCQWQLCGWWVAHPRPVGDLQRGWRQGKPLSHLLAQSI